MFPIKKNKKACSISWLLLRKWLPRDAQEDQRGYQVMLQKQRDVESQWLNKEKMYFSLKILCELGTNVI